jgi:G3E family GTPase
MWIIPKNLHTSAYVQDTEAWISDLNELSEMCEQSLLVRSKPMRQQTWLRKWKRDSWTQHLFGRILRRSHGKSFTQKWTSSVVGFLANRLVVQVGEQETMIQDTYGHTLSKESNSWDDLPLFSSKMLRESFHQNSNQRVGQTQSERPFCNMSLESWKGWVTKQRQVYLVRAKSVHPIKENECLFLQYQTNSQKVDVVSSQNQSKDQKWSTPTVMDSSSIEKSVECLVKRATGARKGRKAPGTLNDQVNPIAVAIYQLFNDTTQEITEQPIQVSEDKNNTDMKHLEQYLKKQNWATPASRDWKGEYPKHSQEKNPRNLLPDQAHMGTYKGYLNPRWVEQLMGLPVGWVQVSSSEVTITEQMSLECWGMGSSQIQRQELSESCGKVWPTPAARDWKDTLSTVPPSIGKTRGHSLGQALADEIQKESKKWSTPPSVQRGDTLEVYLRRCIKRIKNGGVKFAPPLQVQVEAEDKKIPIDLNGLDYTKGTEELVKEIMGRFYKNEK